MEDGSRGEGEEKVGWMMKMRWMKREKEEEKEEDWWGEEVEEEDIEDMNKDDDAIIQLYHQCFHVNRIVSVYRHNGK